MAKSEQYWDAVARAACKAHDEAFGWGASERVAEAIVAALKVPSIERDVSELAELAQRVWLENRNKPDRWERIVMAVLDKEAGRETD